ncbi:uncharacterized protein LOC131639600 [Vicia villosa]|uniref:uncharacterized protein LOC131639600 n=1 Tax=Vicia villosa TaxID=3911 RepID=UPI00273B5590|nr:uncharacterized protein LOC131639600 [Vicia villosa]
MLRKKFILMLCTMLHKTWLARNNAVFNQKSQDPVGVADDALFGVVEYNRWNSKEDSGGGEPTVARNWPNDVHTVQVDAGVSPNGTIAFGGLIRDHERKIIIVASKKEYMMVEPLVAELPAIRWCLGVAMEMKLDRILLQSNALEVVDCINGCQHIAAFEHIAEDCRLGLNSFKFAVVMFIPRNINVDAHNLVGIGKRIGSRACLGSYPIEIPVVSNSLSISPVN